MGIEAAGTLTDVYTHECLGRYWEKVAFNLQL